MYRHLARATSTVVAVALVLAAVAAPRQASADATQLCRSISTLALAPTDLVFGPWIAAKDLHLGITEIGDDGVTMKMFGAAPGFVFLSGLQAFGTGMRVIAGLFEFVPGLVTLFQEGSQPALFRNQDETFALYSNDFGPCPVRIGSSYNTINEG